MRTSTLFRSPRPGRHSRLVSVPVTGAAALVLVLTGCGGGEVEDGVTAVDIYNEEFGVPAEDTEALEDVEAADGETADGEAAEGGAVEGEAVEGEAAEGEAAGGTGGAAAAVPGSFVVGDVPLPPLLAQADPQAALAELPAEPAVATSVPVLAVPTDEGFWIGSQASRIWVQLVDAGESPVEVDPGDQVSFTGEVVPNADGFVESLSLPADQAAALTAIGYHVEVSAADVTTG